MLCRWAQGAFNKEDRVKGEGKTEGAGARVGWKMEGEGSSLQVQTEMPEGLRV